MPQKVKNQKSKKVLLQSLQITKLDKLYQLVKLTEMVFLEPENQIQTLLDLMEILKTLLSQLPWKINSLKASLNVSSLNKIWSELLKDSLAEEKLLSVQLLLPSLWELLIKLELQESVQILWNVLDLTQVVALDKMDLLKWLWKILPFSELFLRVLFWYQVMQFQLKEP